MSQLAEWDSFFVIVGSAAGALIGLQFVLVTLIADRPRLRVQEAGAAFAMPTIAHLGHRVVFVGPSARSMAEHHPAIFLGHLRIAGAPYAIIVVRRMRRRQTVYQPEFEDWLFHVLLPLAGY